MTFDEIRLFFEETDKLLLTTHESPDGDGLGAEYALCEALLKKRKEVRILNADIPSSKYAFIDKKGIIKTLGVDAEYPDDLENWTLVVLDTEPTNIGNISEITLETCREVIVVDHHKPKSDANYRGWLASDSSSTCEMVFRILEAMKLKIYKDIAVALYTGIVYDTGSFVYPKTHARTFQIAEKLVAQGVVPNKIYTKLYESKSSGALICQSLVSSTMFIRDSGRVGVQIMPRETLIASGAGYDETQEIINIPLQCSDIRVSVFLKENEQGIRRCSLRSKGEVDCATIAQSFGGGGHKTAAGFKFVDSFEEILEKILDAIHHYLT